MNALRNIFSSRTLNLLRQNGQNAIINATQQQQPGAVGDPSSPLSAPDKLNDSLTTPLSIPRSILDACRFTGKPFDFGRNNATAVAPKKPPGSLSPTTLKRFRRMQRRMELVYRCKLCNTRNTKTISEEAYYSGVVILQCDGCAVDHLIKDNLGLFSSGGNGGKSIDQVLSERAERVRVIRVNEQGELI
ncbi:DNL-type zinc finger protein [Scaptodrosophila lebanonensis]|uniref:DNL-type zinc finger protein n=1 Tax=Drosophila lebanonensis TaxID=7225 RepID=A0A6J2TNI9_DROLE|nr:DNL-type zinc finger protein [Scaptodrosophila lebanonensis]